MNKLTAPEVGGTLRDFMLKVPEEIYQASGIVIFGKRIKSVLFSTDVSIICNTNADAIIAVYPFTPQPIITQAILSVATMPVFSGVGGGLTKGVRVSNLALHAELQGAHAVVVNQPTSNEDLRKAAEYIDIPVIVTVVSETEDIAARLANGAKILNVSAAARTPSVVAAIREKFPTVPIMATGGPTAETITATIKAGANAITWTPPSNGEIFRGKMDKYRENV